MRARNRIARVFTALMIMATTPHLALAQEPCGSFLNPCHMRMERQQAPQPFKTLEPFKPFDYGAAIGQGNSNAGQTLQNMLMIEQLKRARQQEIQPQPQEKSLLEDWSAGYKDGYAAATKEYQARLSTQKTAAVQELADIIYLATPEHIDTLKSQLTNDFKGNTDSNIYKMISDLLTMRSDQISKNEPTWEELAEQRRRQKRLDQALPHGSILGDDKK